MSVERVHKAGSGSRSRKDMEGVGRRELMVGGDEASWTRRPSANHTSIPSPHHPTTTTPSSTSLFITRGKKKGTASRGPGPQAIDFFPLAVLPVHGEESFLASLLQVAFAAVREAFFFNIPHDGRECSS